MGRLKRKHEIPNYDEKAKVLHENGWETWYHDDNWIKTEWHDQEMRIDMMGRSTEDVYENIIRSETKDTTPLAVEFLKWCDTPVYRAEGELGSRLRVIPQFPEYDTYMVIDETGYSVLPKGTFLTAEELYEYWLNNR